MLTREAELGKFLHLDFAVLLRTTPSIYALLERSSLIAVGFGSSFRLLSRGFSFRHNAGEGGRWKREKEGEEAGKHALSIKLRA
jgi:hypothetical protein